MYIITTAKNSLRCILQIRVLEDLGMCEIYLSKINPYFLLFYSRHFHIV